MSAFPTLRTGAVMQYPAERTMDFSTEVLRFVDGSEQRFAGYKAPLRRWVVRLDLLDEGETGVLTDFFLAQNGAFGRFSFTDPWDGTAYPNCSIEEQEMAVEYTNGQKIATTLTIRENRS